MAAKEKQNIITELATSPPGYVLTYKCHCMTAIMPVWLDSSWAFPLSCTTNESHLNSDSQQEGKNAQNSTTKVSFTTKFIHFCVNDSNHSGAVKVIVGNSY